MKHILFCLFLGLSISYVAAQKWSWGPSWQVGYAGDRINDSSSRFIPGFGGSEFTSKTLWQPSFALGMWMEKNIGPHWGLQLGLNYRWLNNTVKSMARSTNTAGMITFLNDDERIVRQQVIDLPFSVRFYINRHSRRYRPFVDLQIAAAYVLKSEHEFYMYTETLTSEPQLFADKYVVDFSADVTNRSRLQAQAGFAIGLAKGDFALSFTKNWTIPTDDPEYHFWRLGGFCVGCDSNLIGYGQLWQTHILDNTNLRLQYNW